MATMPAAAGRTTVEKARVGGLRPSSLMHTFGVGSIVDLPHMSVIVMGIDDWRDDQVMEHGRHITEERLLARIQREPNHKRVRALYGPPQAKEQRNFGAFDPTSFIGVPVAAFPRWLLCTSCQRIGRIDQGMFKEQSNKIRADKNRFVHRSCPNYKGQAKGRAPGAIPVRFVVACENGHLDDFPWIEFAHKAASREEVTCESPKLKLMEIGLGDGIADVFVKCETCDATPQPLSRAFDKERRSDVIQGCTGAHPHLRQKSSSCDQQMRAMLLGASNLWFAENRSVITIPSTLGAGEIAQRVEAAWSDLQVVTSMEVLSAFKKIGKLGAFAKWDDKELLDAIELYRATISEPGPDGDGGNIPDLKAPEWSLFSTVDANGVTSDALTARNVAVPDAWQDLIERVVLVPRLREVQALLGFNRIVSGGDRDDAKQYAPVSRKGRDWVPASEMNGEGVYIQLREDALSTWEASDAADRGSQLRAAMAGWWHARGIPGEPPSGGELRRTLVHSLSHALMRRFALESGYSQTSIRERLYVQSPDDGEPMAGLLLYTAAPDAEGTLGGLVAQGDPERLAEHLRGALEDLSFCASDPLCAEHDPATNDLGVHGAACHACLFAPETSCEDGNRFLDRAVLVELVDGTSRAYFPSVS